MYFEKKEITPADLKVGVTYFGKRRIVNPLTDATNDRIIVWFGVEMLQYDSDTVKIGKLMPRITVEKFCKWAGGIVHEDEEKPSLQKQDELA